MASETNSSKNPKKANLLDHNSLKHILDESTTEIVKSRRYEEDVRMSNVRLLMGTLIIIIALVAQFYPKKFPENRNFLIGCIILYIVVNGLLQLIIYTKEKNAIMFTYPPSIVKSRGYEEDVRMSNVRLLMGTLIIIIALVAQFYPKKFPENRNFLIGCIILYIVVNGLLQLIIYTKEKNAIMFTYPPSGSFHTTGLTISSKLPRFSDMYTLTIESADPKSISANKPVELTKSVTKWFTKDGVLVEGLFWKDVQGLIDEYNKEPKKNK